jgi:hypothetical protein
MWVQLALCPGTVYMAAIDPRKHRPKRGFLDVGRRLAMAAKRKSKDKQAEAGQAIPGTPGSLAISQGIPKTKHSQRCCGIGGRIAFACWRGGNDCAPHKGQGGQGLMRDFLEPMNV